MLQPSAMIYTDLLSDSYMSATHLLLAGALKTRSADLLLSPRLPTPITQ